MTDALAKIGVIQEVGETTLDLLEIGFPPAGYDCPVDDDGAPILKEDERYWSSLEEMQSQLESFGPVEVSDELFSASEPFLNLKATRTIDGDLFCNFHVSYDAAGGGVIVVEFRMNDSWHTVIDHSPEDITRLDVGRFVARAELSILANELESPTETLDYWIVDGSNYHDSRFSQSRWADIRNVSRQTVNDRVQSARKKLKERS